MCYIDLYLKFDNLFYFKEEKMDEKLVSINYSVEEIIYRNEDTGFAVLQGMVGDSALITVGELFSVEEGETLFLTGFYVDHPSYGHQFKVKMFERSLPTTERSIKKFLSSGSLKGIGPVLAERIVNSFGSDTLKMIEEDPDCLSQIKGISPAKVEKIKDEFNKLFAMRKLINFIESYGLKSNISFKVWSKWGIFSLDIIQNNPYKLCDEDVGVSFSIVDKIAKELNITSDNSYRIFSGVEYILRYNAKENGHTCVPRVSILPIACSLLGVDSDCLEFELNEMIQRQKIYSYNMGKEMLFLPSYYVAEQYISRRISELVCFQEDIESELLETLIKLEEERMKIRFAKMQEKAIRESLCNNLFILSGGPGTGKTTILNAIISILEQKGLKITICAPTGRAAKRLSEITGREAMTIHRLLGVQRREEDRNEFVHNEKNLLKSDVIVIDEMSMVDSLLFCDILKAAKPECKLILTGDYHQLPSVSAGNVLKSLIFSECIPHVELKEIFRQSAESLIITNAHSIINNELPCLDKTDNDFFFLERNTPEMVAKTIVELVSYRLPNFYKYNVIQDIQIVCPSKKGLVGTININNEIQKIVNPKSNRKVEFSFGFYTFREGDKVMQVKNNYDINWTSKSEEGSGIFNGDIGIIRKINKPSRSIYIDFDGKIAEYTLDMAKEIELAYAITVHKSQGNEFKCVVIPVLSRSTDFYNRNLLYTAITRAKENVVLVGSRKTVSDMSRQVKVNYRYTGLKNFIIKSVIGDD